MRRFKKNLLIILALLFVGCFSDKMPLTTSSEQAREFYLTGLDLSERLRRLDAVEFFEKAIAVDSNFAMAYLNLALTEGSTKEFFHNLQKAVKKSKGASTAEQKWIKAWEYRVNGMPVKAESLFRELVDKYPQDERVVNMLATHLFTQQEYEEAIQYYLEAIKINPQFSQAYNQLGYCYRYLGNYVKAEEAFKKYIKIIPDDPNPYDSYAELLLKMGEYEVSIEMYEKSLDIDPDFANSYIGIATNLNLKHEHDEARKQLMDLFRIARSYADRRYALIAIVISYVDEGKYDKALSILDKSITMAREENATADLAAQEQLRAYLLLEFGRLEEAKQAFQRAKMLAEQSELSEEIKDYARQRFFYGKARLAIADKDLATADSALQNFRQEGENNENPDMIRAAHELAGMIAKARGDFQQALTEFAHANQQDPYTFYRIAEVHLELGNKEEALKYFSRAAKFNALNSLNYALIRQSAERRVLDLKKELSRPLSLQLQSVG